LHYDCNRNRELKALSVFVFYTGSDVRLTDIQDGTSSTLLAGERPPSDNYFFGWWYSPSAPVAGEAFLGVQSGKAAERQLLTQSCPGGPYQFSNGRLTNNCDVYHFWSLHYGGANFAFCDGSVRFLTYGAYNAILSDLATRAGGEVVEIP
jgi:prepilin-type processing-associated H-X9-DG protein